MQTRDLGIKWPQWHTLLCEEQVKVDMRVVCRQDVTKMLVKQAKKGAATHECEELRGGVWLDPSQVMPRRKIG